MWKRIKKQFSKIPNTIFNYMLSEDRKREEKLKIDFEIQKARIDALERRVARLEEKLKQLENPPVIKLN